MNNALRQELGAAKQTISQVKRQNEELTQKLAALEAWKARVEQDAHPAIEAERRRADKAVSEAGLLRDEERVKWITMVGEVRPVVARLIRQGGKDDAILGTAEEIVSLVDMFGDTVVANLPGATRVDRRRIRTAGAARAAFKV